MPQLIGRYHSAISGGSNRRPSFFYGLSQNLHIGWFRFVAVGPGADQALPSALFHGYRANGDPPLTSRLGPRGLLHGRQPPDIAWLRLDRVAPRQRLTIQPCILGLIKNSEGRPTRHVLGYCAIRMGLGEANRCTCFKNNVLGPTSWTLPGFGGDMPRPARVTCLGSLPV